MSPRLPGPERRDQLLAVALTVFARQGFHATSMNDIADAAGVTKPVLYQHFTSKRGLYNELLLDAGDRLIDAIAKAAADAGTARAQVERGFAAYFRWVAEDHDAFGLLFGGSARRDDEFAEAVRRVETAVADTIASLIAADIDPEHRALLAHGLVGLAEATSRRLVTTAVSFDPAVVAVQVADFAYAGLRGVHRV